VQNKPEKDEAELKHYMVRNRQKNKSFAYTKPSNDTKEGLLSYKIIGESDKYFLLEIDLKPVVIIK